MTDGRRTGSWNGALLAALLSIALPAAAQEPEAERWTPPPGAPYSTFLANQLGLEEIAAEIPPDEELVAQGARLGEIRINVGDIFDPDDPKEDKKLYRLVNRFHISTRDWVIRQQLLFESGDAYEARLLQESERILRTNRYLFDADIRPVEYHDGVVDVEVTTRDVWTLSGGVSFARSGGENTVSFEIQDFNVLGTGKEIGIDRSSDVDRDSTTLLYRDRNFLGRRAKVELKLAENSDGHRRVAKLERPFYALDARWTGGIVAVSDHRIERIFDQSQVLDRFRHEFTQVEAYWGLSRGLIEGRALRWRLGYTYQGDRFDGLEGRDENLALPPARTLSFPWIELEHVQDRFIEIKDLDRIARTEDLNLGTRAVVRAGWSSPTFGGDREQGLVGCNASRGFVPGRRKLVLASLGCGARWADGGVETLLINGRGRFFWRDWGEHLFFAKIEADYARDLDPEQQLLLGGDSGLRGYPQRYQTGDRRFLVTLEQRFYTDWEPFQLVNVGAAVFFDFGRAWFNDVDGDLGVLKDAGFGLRLSPSRSGRGTLVHLDVAFPLDRTPSIDSVQWLVTTKETF